MRATPASRVVNSSSNGTPTLAPAPRTRPQSRVTPSSPNRPASSGGVQNLVEAAAGAGSFETLGRAIRATGLAEKLGEAGPFTFFAPTDEAFAKLPQAELDALLTDTVRLTQVLTYHIVPAIVMAPKIGSPGLAATIHGAGLKITAKNGGFRVNDALVVRDQILAANGVIHAIDTVLMPR